MEDGCSVRGDKTKRGQEEWDKISKLENQGEKIPARVHFSHISHEGEGKTTERSNIND